MRRSFSLLTLLAISHLPCRAAVSGTVTDRSGNRLAGVGVFLALAGTGTTTDATGGWSLATTGIDRLSFATSRIRWTGKLVELTLVEPAMVSVTAYDVKGTLQGQVASVKLGVGSHSLPLPLSSSGLLWLRVTVNGRPETILAAGTVVGIGPIVGIGHARSLQRQQQQTTAARSQGIVDTLRFTWQSKVVARIPLANPDTSGILVKLRTDTSIAWNDSIAYGSLYDTRDGQVYRTVKIGSQTWMAENLNYRNSVGTKDTLGRCYSFSPESCKKYGRLYTWLEVMAGAASTTKSPSGVKGICPSGWHAPSDGEWSILIARVDGDSRAGSNREAAALKSASGWNLYGGSPRNGIDLYGFSVVPGGDRSYGDFASVGDDATFWTVSDDWDVIEGAATQAWRRFIGNTWDDVGRNTQDKTFEFSLRCLQN